MDKGLLEKIKGYFISGGRSADPLAEELGENTPVSTAPNTPNADLTAQESSNALLQSLLGSVATVADYHFPIDLIGGCCPRVVGSEQDIVWNAAAEAVDTERVHVIWQAQGDKVWYLAVRSSDMSSYPNTWCPFGSLLPGMKDSAALPAIYTYYSDESATMMTVLPDGLQIHRGTTSVVRAKAERVSRELDNAPVVELVPDRIEKLSPIPWYSLSLFEERARRILAATAVGSSIIFAAIAVIIWFAAAMATVTAHADIEEIKQRSEQKSLELLKLVQAQRASPMREHLAKFADINDGLLSLNGYLEVYQIEKNKPIWRAVLPANVTSDRINELGAKTLDANDNGVIVGNSKEALEIGKGARK